MEANGQILSGPHTPSTNRYVVERTGCTAILYKVVEKEKNSCYFQESKFTHFKWAILTHSSTMEEVLIHV